ncbi:MAG TPA: hypothetical protein VGR96_16270 [Acidobacteriaceae bacterium]|nr:hypothetical protein [Acidobacteriaceae bacterium]
MNIAVTACFAVTMAAAATSGLAQDRPSLPSPQTLDIALQTRPAEFSDLALDTLASIPTDTWSPSSARQLATEIVPSGVPLRVQLDKSHRLKVGTRLTGRLTEPVYLVDHVVLPAGSRVFGSITGKHPVSRQTRTAAMFNGDLTPLKSAEVTFTSVETPDGRDFDISTRATERTAEIVRIVDENAKPRRSFRQRIASAFRWTRQQTVATLTMEHKSDRVREMIYEEIPFHPQELWAGTEFDAELTEPLQVTGQPASAPAPAAELSDLKLTGTIEARLLDPVDSATARPGMPVEAVLTQPLFEGQGSQDAQGSTPATHHRGKLLLPEGTRLIGAIVQSKAAGVFGHNGSLRMTFRKAELPAGDERVVHGHLTAAEGEKSAHIRLDDEGGVKATSGTGRFLAPISLGSLAAVGDNAGTGVIREAIAGNGMDMLTRVVGTAFSNGGLITGFGYYEAGKIVFDQWIARGHDVVFARNTRIEIELARR